MKFQLILDPTQEESVVVIAKAISPLTEQIKALVNGDAVCDALVAFENEDIVFLPYRSIECITVIGGKTYAIDTSGKQLRLKERLWELEAHLPENFIRINKSSIANKERLQRFSATYAGGVNALFQSGFTEYVSRRCFAEIKRRFTGK